jgi:Asp-tRNA(Asn)/Glu-tRNA(Gln) amidotransferase A subunit family amidase
MLVLVRMSLSSTDSMPLLFARTMISPGLRVLPGRILSGPEVAAMMREAIAVFVSLGARIVPVTFPSVDEVGAHWTTICATECAAAHGMTYPSRQDEYGPVLTTLLEIGHAATGKGLAEAMQYRLKLSGAVAKTMLDCDLLLVPAIKSLAPLTTAIILRPPKPFLVLAAILHSILKRLPRSNQISLLPGHRVIHHRL